MSHYFIKFPYLTSSLTVIPATTNATQAIARNDNRGSFILTQSGSSVAYVGLGITPTTSSFTFFLGHGDYYEDSLSFKGKVNVIFNGTTGSLYATELTEGS